MKNNEEMFLGILNAEFIKLLTKLKELHIEMDEIKNKMVQVIVSEWDNFKNTDEKVFAVISSFIDPQKIEMIHSRYAILEPIKYGVLRKSIRDLIDKGLIKKRMGWRYGTENQLGYNS